MYRRDDPPLFREPGKRVTVNRIHGERSVYMSVCEYAYVKVDHRRVSIPGLPIVLYNTFTLRPIIILYSGCIVFLSGIMFRRHARPRPGERNSFISPYSLPYFRDPSFFVSLSSHLALFLFFSL